MSRAPKPEVGDRVAGNANGRVVGGTLDQVDRDTNEAVIRTSADTLIVVSLSSVVKMGGQSHSRPANGQTALPGDGFAPAPAECPVRQGRHEWLKIESYSKIRYWKPEAYEPLCVWCGKSKS